jgi:hypothetical protein
VIHLDRVLDALHRERVEFIIIGGMAARAHGSARTTDDLDVVYSRSDGNIARLVKALAPIQPYLRGAPPNLPFEWSAKTVKAGLNFTLTTTLGWLDILGEVAGGGRYEELIEHAESVVVFGHKTDIVSLPWLIRLKRSAGRAKDLEAIAELELLGDMGRPKT